MQALLALKSLLRLSLDYAVLALLLHLISPDNKSQVEYKLQPVQCNENVCENGREG